MNNAWPFMAPYNTTFSPWSGVSGGLLGAGGAGTNQGLLNGLAPPQLPMSMRAPTFRLGQPFPGGMSAIQPSLTPGAAWNGGGLGSLTQYGSAQTTPFDPWAYYNSKPQGTDTSGGN